MKLELYNDINKFIDDVMDAIAKYEIQNNLMISNCLKGKDGAGTSDWFMATVKDSEGALLLAALMTPPHNLVVYEVDNTPDDKAIGLMISGIIEQSVHIPGLLAEKSLAARFAGMYSERSGKPEEEGKKMRIYRLDKVNNVIMSPGRLRAADEKDLFYLPYWSSAFDSDCGSEITGILKSVEKVKKQISGRALYIWEDGIPVSKAAMGRKTLNGAVVNAVYTPPHFRGKGYATSCVAALSRQLLDSGFKFCSLFTDLANPVSNSIYMKIGYKPVCDYDEYLFRDAVHD